MSLCVDFAPDHSISSHISYPNSCARARIAIWCVFVFFFLHMCASVITLIASLSLIPIYFPLHQINEISEIVAVSNQNKSNLVQLSDWLTDCYMSQMIKKTQHGNKNRANKIVYAFTFHSPVMNIRNSHCTIHTEFLFIFPIYLFIFRWGIPREKLNRKK